MMHESTAWEKEYLSKGAVWGGAVHHLPQLPPGTRVLELGCGNGKTLAAMLERGWNVTAIDFSAQAVSISKKSAGPLLEADLCVADARSLPFAGEQFDAVVAVHVLSHLYSGDRACAAAEAVRVVKPGGILYVSGFSIEDFRSGKGAVVEEGTMQRGSGICTHYFTETGLQDLFGNLTLKSIVTKRWSMRVRGKDLPRAEIQAVFTK
jgi:ubiquinone/menaquinone biosynthesis C-methylase UbiE